MVTYTLLIQHSNVNDKTLTSVQCNRGSKKNWSQIKGIFNLRDEKAPKRDKECVFFIVVGWFVAACVYPFFDVFE